MTTEIFLSTTPVKITDGTETAFISCRAGDFRFSDSDTMPVNIEESHSVSALSVNPPFVIWVWAGSADRVSVSKRNI